MPPRYQDIRGGNVQLLTTPDGGALLRVIAGELDGHQGPGVTHTPITHDPRDAGARRARSPCRGARTSTAWRTSWRGAARSGPTGGRSRPARPRCSGAGVLAHRPRRREAGLRPPDLEVVLLGGRPIREPMAHYGPFVMNTRGRAQAGLRGLPEGPARHDPRRARDGALYGSGVAAAAGSSVPDPAATPARGEGQRRPAVLWSALHPFPPVSRRTG